MPAKKPAKRKGRAKRHELVESLRISLCERFGVCAGQRIGVAVSGGADSVALLRLFVELREALGVVVCVAHFNHKLRGKASDADEKFVARLAAQHELEFLVASENVAAKAKRERANLEDAARRARYAFFEQLVKEGRVWRVAVAQTADDQAETVLAHIMRGTGLAGLAGIHPQAGLSTGDLEESHVKRALIASAAETYVLVSAEKLNAASPYVIVPITAVAGIIVEPGIAAESLKPYERAGLTVIRA